MAYPDLPAVMKAAMADEGMRVHHHLWHFVRSKARWEGLPAADRQQLVQQGWQAPRFEDEPGAGLDFLGMHREMIAHANHLLMHAGDAHWARVTAWNPIPWNASTDDWPVPDWPDMPADPQWAREAATVQEMRQAAAQLTSAEYLRALTLDQLGTAMEWSIHGWMHLRWSAPEPEVEDDTDPAYDWLYVPWSSHVNKHFWKLHGWIDARIGDWEAANGAVADLSQAWSGQPAHGHGMHHHADKSLMNHLPPKDEVKLPMRVRQDVIEGVLGGGTPPWG
jgi:hypothetical protein